MAKLHYLLATVWVAAALGGLATAQTESAESPRGKL